MRDPIRKLCYLGSLALLLAITLAVNPLFVGSTWASSPVPRTKNTPGSFTVKPLHIGVTVNYANVRSLASINGTVLTTYPPGTKVTVYETVSGQAIVHGYTNWDLISKPSSSPRYVYGTLIANLARYKPASHRHHHARPAKSGTLRDTTPSSRGKEIVISIEHQWMYAYDNGKCVYDAPITTGQPSLGTPTGTFHVLAKLSPTTFYSPWPPGSPYWYPATHINYALEWKEGGFFLHDSWWRSLYGPGTNVYHYDPVDGWLNGTHGCITMPLNAVAWLYKWASVGTTVRVDP